jgi:hypothetical protein
MGKTAAGNRQKVEDWAWGVFAQRRKDAKVTIQTRSTKSEIRIKFQMTQKDSTKSEVRSSKQIQMIKTKAMFQTPPFRNPRFGISRILAYWVTFVSDFELRILDLPFGICCRPRGLFRYSDFGF